MKLWIHGGFAPNNFICYNWHLRDRDLIKMLLALRVYPSNKYFPKNSSGQFIERELNI
jgi:hypothetical protein